MVRGVATAEVVNDLGLRVVSKGMIKLSDLVRQYVVLKDHPCPCTHGSEERATTERHLIDLARRGGTLLRPALVGRVSSIPIILAPTCVFETALTMLSEGRGDVLERVQVEVWDLGDFGDRLYLAQAIASLLCIVYEGRKYVDIKSTFVRSYLVYRVMEVARQGRAVAEEFIKRLEGREDLMKLALEVAEVVRLSERMIYNYIVDAVSDEKFINELKMLITNIKGPVDVLRSLSEAGDVGISIKLAIIQIAKTLDLDKGDIEDLRLLGRDGLYELKRIVKELVGRGRAGDATSLIMRLRKLINGGDVHGAMLELVKWREEALGSKSTLGNNGLVIKDSMVSPSNSNVALTIKSEGFARAMDNSGNSMGEGAVLNIDASDRSFKLKFEVDCNDNTCRLIKELLNALKRNHNDVELMNTLLGIVKAYEVDKSTIKLINELLRATASRDLRDICELMNEFIINTYNKIPREVRDAIRDSVKTIDCSQYPTADAISEFLNRLNNRRH
ncbi:hypothetical protein VMUT_1013 [Vulcanisaeta moutnovskia 768-28]|uniref:Uncharacterized protein n=1 Tax=Vulcanisaeta moutnovskia (strain 768-28) TaxID=985053 RepID=F0QXQ7_VULM7|nr:hypothetical protein [Vulcanisaeta moutnovskia]ADY01220.1 hypothetical protein VMUT_1013 [Vulcanisaeta moutnovskia 768-28]